ncbi:MarR family transcriptional regulator [Streptococcus suis]|nr:MarR family transcriptional regulator [Streptococcus suis]
MTMMNQWLELRRLERRIQADMIEALNQASYVMSLNEYQTLYFLNETEGKKLVISELSDKIGLSISATSRMLVRFENQCGVIERQMCSKDKRAVEVVLTDLGRERLAIAQKAVQPVLERYQDQLNKGQG